MNYAEFISEMKENEKKIRQQITVFRQKAGGNESTIDLEGKIKGMLKDFKDTQSKLETAYNSKNAPGGIPQTTIINRQQDIQKFKISYNEMEKEFQNCSKEKYRFKNEITEDYSQKEEYKNMNTGEIMQLQKKKLSSQDEQIDDIILDVKKGTQLAKNAGHVIKEQNKQLDQMNEDIERTKERMETLTGRFERYVAKFSTCKMIIILIIELAIAVVVFIFLFK